jgi:hypothetical protein
VNFLVALARAVVGMPPPRPAEAEADPSSMALGEQNPLDTAGGSEARRNAALSMVDEDCHGFLLVTVHRQPGGKGRLECAIQIKRGWWPSVIKTLELIIAAAKQAS